MLTEGIELLSKTFFDVVLLDMSITDSYGPETFFRLHAQFPEMPIIILTGNRNDALIGDLLQNGAQDYLIKGIIEPEFLMHSIIHAIERQRLLVSLHRKTDEIQSLRESLEHLVINNVDAILVIDLMGIILYCNPAAAQIFNQPLSHMVGQEFGFPIATGKTTELDVVRRDGGATVAELCAVEMTWRGKPAYLASIRDITKRKEMQERMTVLSFHDSLTGLYNRAYLDDEFKRLDFERNYPIGLIMGDINNLKLVNDALGHLAGDQLLIDMANLLRSACRKDDIVVRYGGDEFVILLTKCDERTASRIVQTIKTSSRNMTSNSIPVSIALGIAIKEKPGPDLLNLIKSADEHMYANKLADNASSNSSFIASLEKSLYEKDYITAEHALRVRDLCVKFGEECRLDSNTIDELILLASLHDIGKIAVPEAILKKKGPLTDDEWNIIKKHPETGYRITRAAPGMGTVSMDVLSHHERWDGNGYPQNLKGEEIPLASRILSIVDTFDVITHDRPYREAATEQEALKEITRCGGTQFDPVLAEKFVEFYQKKKDKSKRIAFYLGGERA